MILHCLRLRELPIELPIELPRMNEVAGPK